MKSQMQDLVSMRDVESLYEIMTTDDDWMLQLDAAEGLLELGDRRGLEYLRSALDSDVLDMADTAREILDSTTARSMQEDIDLEKKRRHETRLQAARKKLQEGQKLFRYKAVYLAAADFLKEAMFGQSFDVAELNEYGLEGWEVVNVLPNLVAGAGSHFGGVYLLLKKELTSKDTSDLDEL